MNTLNFSRLLHLIKIDIVINKKNILITTAMFIVVFALLPFHISGSIEAYSWLLYIGGFMITNKAFNEMHDKRKAYQYLTLPCSNMERFLSKFLLSTMIYAVALLIVFYFFSVLSFVSNLLFFHNEVTMFDLTESALWIGIGKYIILQSLFLLGSAYFKKYSITKTTLAIGCFLIILAMLLSLISWIICPTCSNVGLFDLISQSMNGLYFIFWIIIAPFCWILTYVRISESEIK